MEKIRQSFTKESISRFLFMNFGLIIVALGTFFFKNPNKIASGGVNGLAIVIQHFVPGIPIGLLMLGMNMILLVLAFLFVGRQFAVKSIYGSIMFSVYVWLLETFVHVPLPLTTNVFMELLYGTLLSGIGVTMVFYTGASTGGTDILAKMLNKFFGIRLSMSVLLSDVFIAMFAGFVYGVEVGLLSLMGVLLKSFVMDFFLESLQVYKVFTIISNESQVIQEYIMNTLHRGATVHFAEGAFTDVQKEVITTVLNKTQAIRLQDYIEEVDPKAFVIITNSSRIIGRGFVSSI